MSTAQPPRIVTAGARNDRGGVGAPRRRRRWWPFVLLVILLLPAAEITALIATGRTIGVWWTLGLLVLMSVVGAWLIKREGRSTWRALTDAVRTGRMPTAEMSDAALVWMGGALLLLPGFLSDIVAFFLILPVFRPLFRRLLQRGIERRVVATVGVVPSTIVPPSAVPHAGPTVSSTTVGGSTVGGSTVGGSTAGSSTVYEATIRSTTNPDSATPPESR